MAKINTGSNTVLLQGISDPIDDQDAATKAYVDANGGGSDLTAGTGITITDDAINIATGGVDTVQLAAGAVDTNRLGDDAVSEAKIADIAVKERHLDITNTPTAGQILTSATDTTQFTWADAGGNTDYNDAPFGNFDEDGSITWTFNETGDPSNQGEVSFTDNGTQGYTLRFRTADVDTINSVSVNFFQIGFGSPIAFATYAVADLVIADDFVDVSIINGPLDGDDVLATFPTDNTALSIIVSVSQFRLPLSSLEDVNIPTPIGTHGLIYDGTNNEWVSSETVNQIADGGHIDVSTVAGVATLTFDETFDLWQKNDWVQINTGTPSFADDEILWDTATETLTVPSLNGRTIENILLSARTGMGIQIRRQQTNVDPVGFTSGFYQILSISASIQDDQVVVQLLPDETDIFNEPAGGTFTYELVVLQFITGGTLNNLTLNGLADTNFSTAPTAGQVLGFNSNGVWVPQDAAAADISGNVIGDLSNVSATAATDNQVLTWDDASSEWAPADPTGGGQTDTDYNNASYGALSDPAISYSYTVATSPVNEGEVSIGEPDSPTTGFTVTFRKEDVATEFLQSLHIFQIGFGSPIEFATYAVSSISINNGVTPQLVVIDVVAGPLAGDDLLGEVISDNTALSISVSSNEFDNPGLGALQDVDFSTAPTDGQVIAYESSTGLWKPADDGGGVTPDLGDLGDVNTSSVADGFVIRYDGTNSDYRVHSVGDTNRVYGGIDIDLTDTFTIPNGSGIHAIAIGNDADATGSEAIAIGSGANATFSDAVAIGQSSQAVHTDSVALGTNSSVDNAKEIRLGDHTAHVTINPTVAGNESEDNQLVSKRWVNNQISDASRVVSSTANAIENLTVTTESTPWDDYRIVPGTALVPELQVHMYEYDATEAQFIFYPGFLSDAVTGDGTDITTGTIPDFFEEVTNIANEAEVTNAGGTAVTSLGWKYLGHDTATVWQAVSHVYTFDFEWIYPAGNTDGAQNPPDVTSSLELVRLKPLSDNTYNMATNATVIASSPTSFHNAGTLNPGDSESFTGSYEFAQQTLADGISNVENGDVFAYRMKVRYKGNGFDGDTNVRLSITESETTNIVPQIGIRHVGRDYSLTLEDSGDLQWTDHGSAIETSLLLVENTDSGPEIPAAALGLIAGDNITISGKTISSTDSQVLTAGNGVTIASDVVSVDLNGTDTGSGGLELSSDGLRVALSDNSALSRESDGLQVRTLRANGTTIDTTDNPPALGIAFDTETNNPLGITGTGTNAGLSLNIDSDGPLQKTANGLDVIVENVGGLGIGSLNSGLQIQRQTNSGLDIDSTGIGIDLEDLTGLQTSANGLAILRGASGGITIGGLSNGLEILLPANSGLQTTATGLSLNADIGDLNDVASTDPTDGQILHWNATSEEWEPTTLANDGTDLTFNAPLAVSDTDVVTLNRGAGLFLDSSNSLAVNPGAGINVSTADGVSLNSPISGLNDVDISSAAEFEILSYDGTDAWNNTLFNILPYADVVPASTSNRPSITAGIVDAVVIGGDTTVSANQTTAVGNNTTASGVSATALGDAATASSTNTIAIGHDSSASGSNSISVGNSAGSSGTDTIAIGNSAAGTGARSIMIGSDPSAGDSALAIAIGERAQVTANRGIAIGTSADSSNSNAERCRANGQNTIAMGRAAAAHGTNSIALGNSTDAGSDTDTNSVAIGNAARATGSSCNAIGNGAVNTTDNTTVLGNGASHRVFAGDRELATSEEHNDAATAIACTIGSTYWAGDNFNPAAQTLGESLKYSEIGNIVIGQFEFELVTSTIFTFKESDRWTLTSTSTAMTDCFGYATPDYGIALGTFTVAGTATNSAAFGDFYLQPGTTTSSVVLAFRIRSSIGTAPTRDAKVSCQFNLAKL